jgi:hypothetical protein
MNLPNRGIALIAIVMLFIILLPTAVGLVNLAGGDDSPDDFYLQSGGNIAVWAKMQDHQILSGLMMRIAVFALIVVYLGGRSNDRRFNDRTIDSVNLLEVFFRDGSVKSRFCFLTTGFN